MLKTGRNAVVYLCFLWRLQEIRKKKRNTFPVCHIIYEFSDMNLSIA